MRQHDDVIISRDEFIRRADAHYTLIAQNLHYERALKSIVAALGPEICSCEGGCEGLRAEAHDALETAKNALLKD